MTTHNLTPKCSLIGLSALHAAQFLFSACLKHSAKNSNVFFSGVNGPASSVASGPHHHHHRPHFNSAANSTVGYGDYDDRLDWI